MKQVKVSPRLTPLYCVLQAICLWCANGRLVAPAPAPAPATAPATAPASTQVESYIKAAKPPQEPHHQWYDDVSTIAEFVEERQGVPGIVYEGTNVGADLAENDAAYTRNIFDEEPSIFGHCVLIRDIAEPLRVGSSLALTRLRKHRSSMLNSSIDATEQAEDKASSNETGPAPPGDDLLPRGGVMDKSGGEDGTSENEEHAELKVEMFAVLQTVAGEVAVIPNGYIAQWGSKRKVPIAGYLCTDERGPVLHTLPTPCLPTSLDDEGLEEEPPEVANMDVQATFNLTGGMAPSPSPALALAAQHQLVRSFARGLGPGSRSPAPAPASRSPAPSMPATRKFHVYVGNKKLAFPDKPTAENFCVDLAKEIAEEMGDTEWDPEKFEPENKAASANVLLPAFVQTARVDAQTGWTIGVKSVLVVVMDWALNDRSRAPHSRQTLTPQHYESKIFPRVSEAFRRMSYGKFDINPTFIPDVVHYKSPRRQYVSQGYPFPGLYNGARESVAGDARFANYRFDDYDLVYVIAPQQAPIGTKGVAFCGAKGAICNGCEQLSESFQVMVAVHELGHNLGLMHAGSSSLEYGNVYDWMGNYPDVNGLSYGLGYKLRLGWVPEDSVVLVDDSDVSGLNDVFNLKPFDSDNPASTGDILGIQLRLGNSDEDLFLSFRGNIGEHAGVFVVKQNRQRPDSELIDMACHSPSQQDAALQKGWTFVDPTEQVVVKVVSITASIAKVHLYKVPSSSALASIRGRASFSDGRYKCPRTCTDSDMLVAHFNGCKNLAGRGYCRGGKIGMGGSQYSVGTDLCPKSCDQCEAVLSGSPEVNSQSACADRNVKIGRKTCSEVARAGECDYSTNLGHIGRTLCQRSCGYCSAPSTASSSAGDFGDPTPSAEHGTTSSRVDTDWAAKAAADTGAATTQPPAAVQPQACTDDPEWKDPDGDDCSVYRDFIQQQRLTRSAACNYNDGAAKVYCRATCRTCTAALEDGELCQDKQCPSFLFDLLGQCVPCAEWPSRCNEASFRSDCPRTCGVCTGPTLDISLPEPSTTLGATPETTTEPAATTTAECKDEECISAWYAVNDTDTVCYKCADYKDSYCGDLQFRKACPRSCDMCSKTEEVCQDDWSLADCQKYAGLGWCKGGEHDGTPRYCRRSCGLCGQAHLGRSSGAVRLFPAGLLAMMLLLLSSWMAV